MQDNRRFEDVLSQSDLFRGLSQQNIRKLLPLCSLQTYQEGHRVFQQGERLDRLYIVVSGKVALARATRPNDPFTEVPLHTLETNQCMAWSSLVSQPIATLSAQVLEDAEVLAVEGAPLRSLLERDHALAHLVLRRLVEILASRLRGSYAFLESVL